jgi:large subunit ribosomal protein L15
VTPELLRAHGFIRRATDRIKVLGDGELKTKLAIHAHAFSASAKEKITKAGGTFELVA